MKTLTNRELVRRAAGAEGVSLTTPDTAQPRGLPPAANDGSDRSAGAKPSVNEGA